MTQQQSLSEPLPEANAIVSTKQFQEWIPLNDTIMGGSSKAICRQTHEGLLFEGDVIEIDGGFVSCQSPLFDPPLNLSLYRGLKLMIDGDGRTFKFAVGCKGSVFRITDVFQGGVRWVKQVPTNNSGTTAVDILFEELQPAVRAKPIKYPLRFNPSKVNQFQLLHSRFGSPGEMNPGFKPGPIQVLLRSISGIL